MPNFKTLCDAAVTMGEMSQGTADYFHGLYLNSDECRELAMLRELVGVRSDAQACASDAQHWLKLMAAWDENVVLRAKLAGHERRIMNPKPSDFDDHLFDHC